MLSIIVLDALGSIGNRSDSQIIGSIENAALEVATLTGFHLTYFC